MMDMKPELKKFKEMVSFKTKGNNLYVDFKMDPVVWKGVEEMMSLNMDRMKKGRKIGRSWRNSRKLSDGIQAYIKENDGKLPNSLADVADYVDDYENALMVPATGKTFVYTKAVNNIADAEDPAKVVILQGELENGTITGYLNGRFRMIRNEQAK